MPLPLRALFWLVLPAVTLIWIPSFFWTRERPVGVTRFVGAPLIVVGAAILLYCVLGFASKGKGTLSPVDPPKRLVTSGLYRFVRNPMYVGGVLVLVGQAILLRSSGLLLYAFIWWLAVHLFIVLYEEPHLRSVFGSEYEEYRRGVPRWIARPRKR
ncbi:MAG TPA: isoprenylcysteine carboxylmethyltransferase family protein [Thermoanaerobaculia bacterium]|nr:isoprenylcysteine carboxylmethyltransferase family protein [Thermoanaerobaculia bacterium]